ncbi:DUF2993 domain-containing protein [Leptolyngbya sp. GB1-A1]|uniref:LmeA family phospholipid-binding protein n=1 Tax=Leptolyngbya sp. GB1-A1 TaxID=2933908 RepID=UPI0032992259
MKRESSRFSQQAINRIAEIAIASQLKQDVDLSVNIAATLKQLAKGQIDAIVILIERLVLSRNLKTEAFQLDIGAVTVKPLSALKGQIKLLHPSQGKLSVVINENDLTTALNQAIAQNSPQLNQITSPVRCSLVNNTITIQLKPNPLSDETESIVLMALPPSEQESKQGIVWQHSLSSHPSSQQSNPSWASDVIASLDRLLNLKDFEQKGLFLTVQEIQIADGKLRLNADAFIQEFPPD